MKRLKLPMNAEKTRCCRAPAEPVVFLGYRIGHNYRPGGHRAGQIAVPPAVRVGRTETRRLPP